MIKLINENGKKKEYKYYVTLCGYLSEDGIINVFSGYGINK